MRTLAVLPVKRYAAAKQRLDGPLGAEARGALAEAMLRDVLAALPRVRRLEGVVVVTGEPRAAALAVQAGADVIDEGEPRGHSAAALIGVAEAGRRRCERALLVPGDCPALEPGEVDELLDRAPPDAPGVTIVPDRHGTGTNALLISPPDAIAPAFGPGSCRRHRALAEAAGAAVAVMSVPSLALDLDTPEDVGALRAALADRPGRAPRTLEVLDALDRGALVGTPGG